MVRETQVREIHVHADTKMDVDALGWLANADAQLVIGPDVWVVLGQRRDLLLRRLAQGDALIYGANTGVGAMKTYRVPAHALQAFNDRLVRDHVAGFGPVLDRGVARRMMAIRIVELAHGGSGISLQSFRALVDAYNAGLAPVVPSLGSTGEGDITLLAHMAYALQGHGRMWTPDGRITTAGRALKAAGLDKLTLEARDGLALIGSNAGTVARATESLMLWGRLRRVAVPVIALSWLAWRANPDALGPEVLSLVNASVAEVGREVLSWIAGTPVAPRDIQDPLSWRCMPHALGAADQAARQLAHSVESLVQSPRDNPVVLSNGKVVSNGNFDVTDLALHVDMLRGALLRVIAQQAQRSLKLLNHYYSGMVSGLALREGDAGLGLLEFNISGLITEAISLAQAPLMQWGEVAEGIEDYGTLVNSASLRLEKLLSIWRMMTATEWVIAGRAIEMQKLEPRDELAVLARMTTHASRRARLTPFDRVSRMEATIARGFVPKGPCRSE